jgi:hypothetical protein
MKMPCFTQVLSFRVHMGNFSRVADVRYASGRSTRQFDRFRCRQFG